MSRQDDPAKGDAATFPRGFCQFCGEPEPCGRNFPPFFGATEKLP